MARPVINVAFTKEEDKDTFNRIEPTRDRLTKKFVDILNHLDIILKVLKKQLSLSCRYSRL
jgi:hypothetical protein